ncbi:MAG: carboxypeptidase-like regulatory domain-containing protein, partial [Candidatus Acidiferrales bacterium]
MTKHNWIYRVALVIGLAMMATVLATAQSGTSAIHGTVVDPQNSVIPNATVVLTNSGNNSVRTATTGPTGSFSFDLVSPGNYRLEVHATGFQNVILNSVQALVDRPTELHLKMSLGVASQTVTVEASAAEVQVNTEDSSLGNDFVNKQITQL